MAAIRELTPDEVHRVQKDDAPAPVRELNAQEIAGLEPEGVVQEQGVSFMERLALNVLGNDPERAKFWLRRRGIEVAEYGKTGDFNFAVRRDQNEPWRVVNPKGFDMQDILADILPEFALGAITELGRAAGARIGFIGGASVGPAGAVGGGALGQAVGAGVTGAVEDILLQELGVLVGVNEKIDPLQVGLVGVASAALPSVGRRVKAIARSPAVREAASSAVGRVGAATAPARRFIRRSGGKIVSEGAEVLAKFAGFPEDFALTAKQSLIRTARRLPFKTPTTLEAVDVTRGVARLARDTKLDEAVALEKMLEGAGGGRQVINVADEVLATLSLSPNSAATDQGARLVRDIQDQIKTIVHIPSPSPDVAGVAGVDVVTGALPEAPIKKAGRIIRSGSGPSIDPITGAPTGTFSGVSPTSKGSVRSTAGFERDVVTGAVLASPVAKATTIRTTAGRVGRSVVTGEPQVLVTVKDALELKRLFGRVANEAGLFKAAQTPTTKKFAHRAALRAGKTVRQKLKDILPESDKDGFEFLNKKIKDKLDALQGLERFLSQGSLDPEQLASLAQGQKISPESFFKRLRGSGSQTTLRAVRKFDRVWGKNLGDMFDAAAREVGAERTLRLRAARELQPNIEDLGLQARIGGAFGESSKPGFIPPLGATGAVKSAAAFGSLFGAAELARSEEFTGKVPGAAFVGGALGFALASPRVLAMMTRRVGLPISRGTPQKITKEFVNKVLDKTIKVAGNPRLTAAERAAAFAITQAKLKELNAQSKSTVK